MPSGTTRPPRASSPSLRCAARFFAPWTFGDSRLEVGLVVPEAIQTGHLAAMPQLKTSQAGTSWCEARIIHNDRERSRDGSWRTISTVAYTVRVYGRQAELLVEAA